MIGDSIGKGVQARQQLRAAKQAQAQARDDRERGVFMSQQMDWKPEYASEHVGAYQKAETPIADTFLNSFLTDDNASAQQGTRAGAPAAQANATNRSAQRYGTVDQLVARNNQVQKETPWAVTPFTREIDKPDVSQNAYEADRAGGLSPDQLKALAAQGFKFNTKGQFRTVKSGGDAKALMKAAGIAPDSEQGRQYMRGVASALSTGTTMEEIARTPPARVIGRGGRG